jgi:hypothetical protein
MKLLDFLNDLEKKLDNKVLDLEYKNIRLKKNNKILKQYQKLREAKANEEEQSKERNTLEFRPVVEDADKNITASENLNSDESNKDNKNPTSNVDEDLDSSLPSKLDEILKLAKSARISAGISSSSSSLSSLSSSYKSTIHGENARKNSGAMRTSLREHFLNEKKPVPHSSSSSISSNISLQSSKPPIPPSTVKAVSRNDNSFSNHDKQLRNHKVSSYSSTGISTAFVAPAVTSSSSSSADKAQFIFDQLQILSKIRLFSRVKLLFLDLSSSTLNDKLLTSRSMILSKSHLFSKNLVFSILQENYGLLKSSSSSRDHLIKEMLISELSELKKQFASSSAMRSLSSKEMKLTSENYSDLFLLWSKTRHLYEKVEDLSSGNHEEQSDKKENQEFSDVSAIVSILSRHLSTPFCYQFPTHLLPQSLSLSQYHTKNKKALSSSSTSQPFSVNDDRKEQSHQWKNDMSHRIDKYYDQLLHLIQYIVEKVLSEQLTLLQVQIRKLIENEEQTKKISFPKSNVQDQTATSNHWKYLLKIFRILQTVLMNEGKFVSCTFLHKEKGISST